MIFVAAAIFQVHKWMPVMVIKRLLRVSQLWVYVKKGTLSELYYRL